MVGQFWTPIDIQGLWDLSPLARGRPDEPANCHVTEDDIRALCALASHHGFKVPRGPPVMTVAGFVVLTGGLAGFHPSKRQPLSGTQKSWEGRSSCLMQSSPSRPRKNGTG